MTSTGYSGYGVGVPVDGTYRRVFFTYAEDGIVDLEAKGKLCNGRPYKLTFNLRPFGAIVFEVPYHASTEEEKKKGEKGNLPR